MFVTPAGICAASRQLLGPGEEPMTRNWEAELHFLLEREQLVLERRHRAITGLAAVCAETGAPGEGQLDELDAAERKWREAKADVDKLTEEYRWSARRSRRQALLLGGKPSA